MNLGHDEERFVELIIGVANELDISINVTEECGIEGLECRGSS